jgi:multiple sugar transport system permease protein
VNSEGKLIKNKKSQILYCVKILGGIILGCLFLIPIYMLFVSSFKPAADVFDLRFIPKTISLAGYNLVLKQNFLKYFLNSLFISTTVTIVALVFHSMAGYALARLNFAGRNIVFTWILSTLMVPFAVILVPLFILVKQFGWLNSFQGVIIPAIPHAYGIFLFRQFFLTMPKELEEAATLDGCSPFGIFIRIYLPLSKPIIITLAVAFFVANWNNYLWPLIVNQNQDKWVLQVALAKYIGRTGTPWDAIMAGGVITVIPMMILFFILQRYIVEGIKMSGIK